MNGEVPSDYLCKDELCSPKHYTSLGLEFLGRADLTNAEKLILMGIHNFIRGADPWTDLRMTIRVLAAMTALDRGTVIRGLASLRRKEVLHRRQCGRGRFRYAVYRLCLEAAPAPPIEDGGATPPRRWRHATPPVAPRHPAGGATPPLFTTPSTTANRKAADPELFEANTLDTWRSLYHDVFAAEMPHSWEAVIRQNARAEPALVAAVSVPAMLAGHELARRRKQRFGAGWVVNWLRDEALDAAAAESKRKWQAEHGRQPRSRQQGFTPEQARQEKADAAERRAQAAREDAAWLKLPAVTQERYLAQANRHSRLRSAGPKLLLRIAKQVAWNEQQEQIA